MDFIGRMGNNMFQIAAAYAYCKQFGYQLRIPNKPCPLPPNVVQFRAPVPAAAIRTWREPHYHFHAIPAGCSRLIGYFQSSKYFSPCVDEIRALFSPTSEIIASIHDRFRESIAQKDSVIAIHVRRGDYISNPDYYAAHHVIKSNRYYSSAIDVIKQKTHQDSMKLFVVSDDIEWCRSQEIFADAFFLEESDPLLSLYILGSFKHFIISNSSYSWWAVFLANEPDGVVVSPDCWVNPCLLSDDYDVFEPSWIRIPCA